MISLRDHRSGHSSWRLAAASLLLAAAVGTPLGGTGVAYALEDATTAALDDRTALERGRYAVLIDLDENRLYFKQGERTLWSAPIGTGTGMRVITHEQAWDFSTPTGRFQVQYKERDPVWIAPDWFFVENNRPIPPKNHPSRYMKGTLGSAAVYISPDLAIHGTDRPELIGQRVSHGCIRLENRYAMRLFHNVQVGTEVIIVGGEDFASTARVVDLRQGYDPSLASEGRRGTPPVDRLLEEWRQLETGELRVQLRESLERAEHEDSRWDQLAVILLGRAQSGDAEALNALLRQTDQISGDGIRLEWGTFLTDLYRRSTVATLEAVADLDLRQRRRVAQLLVETMVTLYSGDLDAPSAPWPTGRIPHDLLSERARIAWNAIASVEREERRVRLAAVDEV